MSEIINHEQYTQALCRVIGVLSGLVQCEPQPDGRRGVLERIRSVIDDALKEPEKIPEMPPRTVDFHVQSSNGGDEWIHHTVRFDTATEACCWAWNGHYRWNRIQRVETIYTLVEKPEEGSCT